MAAEFDLSSLKKGQKLMPKQDVKHSSINEKNIPIPSNKNTEEIDPIFDTPPVTIIKREGDYVPNQPLNETTSNDEFHTVNETNSYTTTVEQAPIRTKSELDRQKKEEEAKGPKPLTVVSNLRSPSSSGDLTPFDVSSLPKKKKEIGYDEAEAYSKLDLAIDREIESISERVDAITAKQYEEYHDIVDHGGRPPELLTDQQVEDQIKKTIENGNDKVTTTPDGGVVKKIIIKDNVSPNESIEMKKDTSAKDSLVEDLLNGVEYVHNHVLRGDEYDKVSHAKNWFANTKHLYTSIYVMVMRNSEGIYATHPVLVYDGDLFTAVIEVNDTGSTGVHVLDPNDTIESVCKMFLHRGLLYDFIDYLYGVEVIKMPVDKTPNEQLAIDMYLKIMEAKSNEGDKANMSENTPEKDIDTSPVQEEVSPSYEVEKEDVIEETKEDTVVDSSPINDSDNTLTIKMVVPTEDTTYTEEDMAKDEYTSFVSDDLQKDLNKELNIRSGPSDEELVKNITEAVKAHSAAIKNKINLKNFTIADTPMSAAKLPVFSIMDINSADWVLPNASRVISVRGLSGPEIFAINPQNINKTKINVFRQIYGIIYKHIISKKPNTFEDWMKFTRFSDLDHIYGALMKATFAESNYVHHECPNCSHIFIQDYNFDEDMVKYSSEDAKKRIQGILRSGDSSIPDYEVQLHQISDKFVVGLKDPSIWSMVMETASLSDEFLDKYEDLMDTISFIDSIYTIDSANNKLIPIDFGYDEDNPTKSTARKITIVSDIIRTLPSDNYFYLRGYIAKIFASNNDMSYQIPGSVCPKCGKEIPAETISAQSLLFTRHQLGALGTI